MDRTTIVTVGICLVLLVFWFFKFGMPAQPPAETTPSAFPATEQAPVADSPTEDMPASAVSEEAAPAESATVAPVAAVTEQALDPAGDAYPLAESSRPEHGDLESIRDEAYLMAAVDLRNGGVTRVELMRHLDVEREGPMRLGSYRTPFMYLIGDDKVEWAGRPRVVGDRGDQITLERDTVDGLSIRETWQLMPDAAYRFTYRIEFVNNTGASRNVQGFAVGAGSILPDDASDGPKMGRMGMMTLGADFAPNGAEDAVSLNAKKIAKLKPMQTAELSKTPTDWLAVHNKYFIFYLSTIAPGGADRVPFAGISLGLLDASAETGGSPEDGISRLHGVAALQSFVLPPDGTRVFELTGYAGPKEYRRIRLLGERVDSVLGMDFFFFGRARWMGALSRLVLNSLLKLHDWGLSYGMAIILITLFVKGVFWPLTHKSTVSMRKMQKIQPLVKEIREKYKNDPPAMNQKIMALYKEHKVNPLGGCLPVVCQIPVFLALFNTFRGAIELRHAGFLWVVDLSQPDTLPFELFGLPIRPLPIVMGACMLLQHHFGPSTADPNQKRMMMFMTLFFMFIFYSMPAGLTLYWTVNQLLTMVQHLMLRRADNEERAAGAAA